MTILLTVLHVICCSLLIVVILIQGGRGQGLTGPSFSSGNVQSLFGTRAADFLTKATSAAAILFLLTCIALNYIETKKSKSLMGLNRTSSRVDVDAVKKALEKIKSEAASAPKTAGAEKTAASAAAAVETSAAKAVLDAKNAVTAAAATTASTVNQDAAAAATSTAVATDAATGKQ